MAVCPVCLFHRPWTIWFILRYLCQVRAAFTCPRSRLDWLSRGAMSFAGAAEYTCGPLSPLSIFVRSVLLSEYHSSSLVIC